jgi:hypothetical protein
MGELLRNPDNIRHVAETMAGTDIRYEMTGDHPMVGKFLPDIPLADGRIAERMRSGRPVLFDFAAIGPDGVAGWGDRVEVITVDAPRPPAAAVLVRPDGYVAWAGQDVREGLNEALEMWFGAPRFMAVTQ